MVMLDLCGWQRSGALDFALTWMQQSFSDPEKRRPWIYAEAAEGIGDEGLRLYPPAFQEELRVALAAKRLLFVRAPEKLLPRILKMILESGLCEGCLVGGLEKVENIWGRRWRLAAEKGATQLLWWHLKPADVLGFDVKLKFLEGARYEILKGSAVLKTKITSQSAAARAS